MEASMKKLLLTTTALVAFAAVGAAGAADLPVKAVPVAPVYNWTGCYIGISAGAIWRPVNTGPNVTFVDGGGVGVAPAVAGGAIPLDFQYGPSSTGLGGAQVGCNYQFAPYWMVGLETDISGLSFGSSQTLNTTAAGFPPFTTTASESMNWLGTTRGRLGWVQDNVVLFVTGGGAYAGFNHGYSLSNTAGGGTLNVAATDSATLFGWTTGGGAEVAFGRWSMKAEYLYYNLGNHVLNAPDPAAPATVFSVHYRETGNVVRVGLNYKLGWY
jgi:outer membrane immunogenic protein